MSEIVKILTHTVDLRQTLEKTDLHTLFVMGDNEAHRFELEIRRGVENSDLIGSTVTAYFTNFKEDTTIKVDGKVEGGKAVVVLSKPCYALHGQFVLTIQVKSGEAENTVFLGEGYMRRTKGETIIYDDYIVYDVSTLLAQISAMEAATKAANAAAGRAPYIGGNGNWYVWDAAKGAYADSGQKAQGPKGDQGDVTQEQFNQLSEQKVDKANVVNNFTTTEAGFVADARAVRSLNNKISNAIREFTFDPGYRAVITFSSYRTSALIFSAQHNSTVDAYLYSNGYFSPFVTEGKFTAQLSTDYKTITITNPAGSGMYTRLGVLHLGTETMNIHLEEVS